VIATSTTNSGKVLTAGATAGSLSWTTPTTGTVTSVTGTSPIVSSGGTAPAISLGTVGVANGGTGATTLTGYVKGTGTTAMTASATIPAADISGNITGNAANVTGTVAVANGGTGTTTGSITGTGALTFAAGGTNTNVTLTPNGTGFVDITGGNGTKKLNITDASTTASSISLYINKTGAITGTGYGVNANVGGASSTNFALYGNATGTGSTNIGSYGTSSGAAATNYGVQGSASSGTTSNYGVYGVASGTSGVSNYGGYFSNTSTVDYLKYGLYTKATGASTSTNMGLYTKASGSTYANYSLYSEAITATAGINVGGYFSASGGTTGSYALVTQQGNVGIGTLTPAYQLDVAGDVNLTGVLRVNGAAGTAGQYLKSNGASDPTWSDVAATSATNLAGGSAGTIPYQSAAGTTAQLAAGTAGYLLKSNGAAAPSWLESVPVDNGGTGATTADAALTNLLPTQTGNSGKVLATNGTSATWTTLDYALAGKSSDQAISINLVDVTWTAANTTLRGEITLNANGTYFTLKAGKTYELSAALDASFSASGYYVSKWVGTDNLVVGSPNVQTEVLSSTYSLSHISGQAVAITVFTPAVDTQVKLRLTSISNITKLNYYACWARIAQLP
jgi:hypothetical protein